jgi:phosphonopyruvate decarboxylase
MKAIKFISELKKLGFKNFYGVPDSLLSDISKSLELDFKDSLMHIITQNEGSAVGIAMGDYLSNNHPSVVYLQNSGLGNIVNPISSLLTKEVYAIPLLLLIGWRGQPGVQDEPQHKFQGKVTLDQLALLGIDYQIVSKSSPPDFDNMNATLRNNSQFAFVFEKDFFDKDERTLEKQTDFIHRETYIKKIYENFKKDSIFISTTGKISRELNMLVEEDSEKSSVFYIVGGMGYASSVALGVALSNPETRVICLDGDGALLMHMGILPIIGDQKLDNYFHYILNNNTHESVGNQPTVAGRINIESIAKGANYNHYQKVINLNDMEKHITDSSDTVGPALIEIITSQYSNPNLLRPKNSPIENKKLFMNNLKSINEK